MNYSKLPSALLLTVCSLFMLIGQAVAADKAPASAEAKETAAKAAEKADKKKDKAKSATQGSNFKAVDYGDEEPECE